METIIEENDMNKLLMEGLHYKYIDHLSTETTGTKSLLNFEQI